MKSKTICKNKLNQISKTKKRNKQFGGVKLGQGSYGCAIKPHIECKTPLSKHYQNKSLVSKLIPIYQKSIEIDTIKEININVAIKKLDPKNKYFSYVVNSCYTNFTKEVQNRSNITTKIITRKEFKKNIV